MSKDNSPTREPAELDCKRAMQQLWDYLDRELSPDQMRAVEGHLTACADCLPHELWGTRFLNALHELREQRVMPPELTERVIQELRAAGFTGGL